MFISTLYSLYTQVMLILTEYLQDVDQYLQNVAFSFEKDLNGQNSDSYSSDSIDPIKESHSFQVCVRV